MARRFQISYALLNYMLVTGAMRAALTGFKIDIYAGTLPTSIEDAIVGGTLLVRFDDGGAGLDWAATAVDGTVQKEAAAWTDTTESGGGTAAFFRIGPVADDLTAADGSKTKYRVQGECGLSGSDLNLASLTIGSSVSMTLNSAAFTLVQGG